MLDDVDGMAKEIEDEVYEQIRLFTDTQILTGDGTGNNIEGMDANATAYTAGTFAGTVDNANVFDVIRTAINQVELNNDFPNAVLMHPSDATSMELIKDPTTLQYIMPPFVSAGGIAVKGLPIKTSTVVTAGELYVGNFNRFKVKIREDIVLDVGFRGAAGDWEKNFVSFLGEQRFFAFIPANFYGSIVKADITTAKALLETA
jgi:HK97 family phage major capsid protein